jgi:hypothetical protein
MQTARVAAPGGVGGTRRIDRWWIAPATTALGLFVFFGYLTFRAFNATYVWYDPYISPTVAPPLFTPASGYPGAVPVEHAWFGTFPLWWPPFLPQSPAFFLPGLAIAFRFTCYYYRGAYYKAFWQDPVSCAVGEPRGTSYWGERWFPLVLQNVHRYFAYLAVLYIVILSYDVWLALWWTNDATGRQEFGIGVGTLVMLVNVLLLASYTFGCHSLRHLVGGRRDEISRKPLSEACYRCASSLNSRHMLFAWLSLFSVGLTDVYIRLCSIGVLTDYRIL